MNTSTRILSHLLIAICVSALAPAAEAQSAQWAGTAGRPAPNSAHARLASLPPARFGLLSPASPVGMQPAGAAGYSLPSGQLPYSSTSAMSINVYDDEAPVLLPEQMDMNFEGEEPEMYYPAPRGVKI